MEYKKVSIVIPVYNEEATIEQVIKQVLAANVLNLEKEIIIVDDASTDNTVNLLHNHLHMQVIMVRHEKNQGKGAAIHTGFAKASGDIAVIQDADLEYDPKDLEKVLQPFLESEAKVVYGSRYLNPSRALGFWHSFFNQLFTSFANFLIGQKITDIMTCYKAFNREVLDEIVPKLESQRFGFEPEVTAKVSKLGYKILEVQVSYSPRSRQQGKHMNFQGQVESLLALLKYTVFC